MIYLLAEGSSMLGILWPERLIGLYFPRLSLLRLDLQPKLPQAQARP